MNEVANPKKRDLSPGQPQGYSSVDGLIGWRK